MELLFLRILIPKGQVVISGEKAGVQRACELADEEYGTAIPLTVSGAFHSPLMEGASCDLEQYLKDNLNINKESSIKVITNVYADSADDIKESLVKQLTSPVRWKESVENLITSGIEVFIEVGPRNVLANLMKRIDRSVKCYSTDSLEKLNKVIDEIFLSLK